LATITGTSIADTLTGTSGADSISGLAGNDSILGGAGNDTIDAGDGWNVVNGEGGYNFASFANYSQGAAVTLAYSDGGYAYSADYDASIGSGSRTDILYNIQGVIGSNYNDTIVGGLNADPLSGGGGGDVLDGAGGNDTLTGGAGNDIFILNSSGQEIIVDFTHSQDKIDVSKLGLTNFGDLKQFLAQSGADTVLNVTLFFQPVSVIFKGVSLATLSGGDFIFASPSAQPTITIAGTSGDDSLTGTSGTNIISGGDGNDTIDGGVGTNTIDGGSGFNFVSYANNPEPVYVGTRGTYNNTSAYNYASMGGGARSDTLYSIQGFIGSNYNDTIIGSLNANSLSGGGGADILDGGGGNDTLAGGAGNDIFILNNAGQEIISDFTRGQDKIDLSKAGFLNLDDLKRFLTQNGADTVLNVIMNDQPASVTFKNVSLATLTDSDFLFASPSGSNSTITITGTDKNDSITGTSGVDQILGGDGNDTIDGGDGYDSIDGEGGYNLVSYATATTGVVVTLQPIFIASMGAGNGPDRLYNIQGVIGSSYNDSIVGDLNGNLLLGGAGNDTLDGAGGDDTLGGGVGNDVLTGGTGNDVFLVDGAGQKTITDFTHGQDKIDVSTAGISSFAGLAPHLAQVGADTVVSVTYNGQAASFTLKNVSLATLDAGDFVFAPGAPAPAAPTGLADGAIVGFYVNAAHNTAAQTLTGMAEKGATVTVYDGATKLGTTLANATTGAWSYTLGKLAGEWTHSLTATATDAAANVSVASSALRFKLDTKAPAAPAGLADGAVSAGHVSGAANVATQTLTGTAEAGATVTVYDGATKLGAALASGAGAWSFTLGTLSTGNHSLTATATDVAGNVGAASPALAFTVDALPPPAAPANLADAAIVGGYVNAAHDTAAQVLTGAAEKGVTVTVYDGATKLGTTVADATTGAWSYTLGKLADGAHSLTATATNATAQVGPASTALSFTVDTKAPTAPINLADAAVSAGHVSAAANVAAQALTGTAEAGATITVYDGATTLGTAVASNAGAWSYTLGQLAGGAHSLTATAADAAGNTGMASTALAFTVDAPSPAVPVAPSGLADAAIVNGYVNKAGDTASQTLTGMAGAGVTVTVYDGAAKLGTTTAGGDGAWSYTLGKLADGTHNLTATATDAAAHVSPASTALTFKVDTLGPTTPNGLADAGVAQGFVNAAHNVAGQALTGKTEAGATVTIFDGATQLGTVKAGATGAFSFVLGALSEGGHTLTATAADAAGNTSVASNPVVFTVDTHAPGAPSSLADAAIVGGYVNAARDLATQALTGNAEAYAYVSVYDGATKLGQVQASGTGTWSYTLGKLADGAHNLSATVTDKAGNAGASSGPLAFTVDTHLPAASVSKAVVGAVSTTLSLSGVSEAGATVSVSEGATKLGSAVADGAGAWSVTLTGLTNTLHSLAVTATDLAGNKATAGPTLYNPAVNATILGTAAADVLIGRPGDTLTGGAGSDLFVFGAKAGAETITDFAPSTGTTTGDLLQIDHTLATSFANLMTHAAQVGANVSISFPSGESLVLQNVQLSSLHAGDFLFV
jgi:Ca2+-binding RTX toxin-like protein